MLPETTITSPMKGGLHQPYFQSERLDPYRTYAKKLIDASYAYQCFCSPGKLATTREKLARTGSNVTYDKSCLSLTDEEVAGRVKAREKHVIRMNDGTTPARTTPDDVVFGPHKDAHASLPTDPVLLKLDMFPTYHLASVVDGHEMGITHVRGEEWLPSLPLHLDLYTSLGISPPRFTHLPLLLNPDGSKMSKRKGDVDVMEFMRRGWEPVAVLNWLALAGWGFARDNPTDPSKLEYPNKNHLMETWSQPHGLNVLVNRAIGPVKEAFPDSEYTTMDHIKQVILALRSRITNILDVAKLAPYFFVEPDYGSQEAESMIKSIPQADIVKIPTNVAPRLELVESWRIFMTVPRHALSGMKTSPSVVEIMDALGKERSMARLRGREVVS
ncbi:Nucleotidylyl transferase [Thelephora ganbajun]|uniref:Nucleotidylyl transferase n=1 Tax=Thelephora ganbajun TaxID=370292 RepID=A0ACB6ZHJ5_THEGA|nr:Nucleotidylyl transferase [Thelephora ganbajun]